MNIARDPYTRQWIGAGGLLVNYFPRQFDVGYMNWLDLWETTAASYLSVTFSLYTTPGFPSNMRSIPERFPPLQSRVGQWSKKLILDELGHGGSIGRDRVLARELVNRDLTKDELLEVLQNRRHAENGVLLWTIVETHQVPRFSAAIRKYLLTDRGAENPAFYIVSRAEEVNFTDVAIEVLRQEIRADGAFKYAADHGSLADCRALKDLPPRENQHSFGREEALPRMRKRLGLDVYGNPMVAK